MRCVCDVLAGAQGRGTPCRHLAHAALRWGWCGQRTRTTQWRSQWNGQTREEKLDSSLGWAGRREGGEGMKVCCWQSSLVNTFFPFYLKYAHWFPLVPNEHCGKRTVSKMICLGCRYNLKAWLITVWPYEKDHPVLPSVTMRHFCLSCTRTKIGWAACGMLKEKMWDCF